MGEPIAERTGFEPVVPFRSKVGYQPTCFKPLSHLWKAVLAKAGFRR